MADRFEEVILTVVVADHGTKPGEISSHISSFYHQLPTYIFGKY